MRKREIFYIALFTAVAAVGFINVATGGLVNHLAVDYSPYHSLDEVSIEGDLTVTEEETAEITVNNVEQLTYSMNSSGSPVPDFDFTPSPSLTMESLPPTYVWGFQNPSVEASVSFDTEDVEPGNYSYRLEASGGEYTAEEELVLKVE